MRHHAPRPSATVVFLTLFLTLLAVAFAQDGEDSLAAVVRDTPELSTLASLLENTGLMESLERPTRVTFFAPSDRAFERMGEEAVATLLRDRGSLDLIMRHHLVYGASTPEALRRMDAVTTLEGTRLEVRRAGERVRIGGVRLPDEPIRAANGLIYVVDRLMLPQASRLIKDLLAHPSAN